MNVNSVEQSIENLLVAFGHHDKDAYFACFHPDATFLFYNSDETGLTKTRYQQMWDSWEKEHGFKVLECRSTNKQLTVMGDTAIFTHEVATKTEWEGEQNLLCERESIIFVRNESDSWLCVHEHLSANEVAK